MQQKPRNETTKKEGQVKKRGTVSTGKGRGKKARDQSCGGKPHGRMRLSEPQGDTPYLTCPSFYSSFDAKFGKSSRVYGERPMNASLNGHTNGNGTAATRSFALKICEQPAQRLRCFINMKSLVFGLALFAVVLAAAPQKAIAATVVTSYNWNDPYWNTHKYGYWHGHKGYWAVKNGRHVFVVVP
jgi:hypothetical protein